MAERPASPHASLRRPVAADWISDPEEPVELFWTADAQFLVDAAALLDSASIPFDTEGAETLNPESQRTPDDPPEPTVARLLVPAVRYDQAEALLDHAGLDPGDSTLGQIQGSDPPDTEPNEPVAGEWRMVLLGEAEFWFAALVAVAILVLWLTG